MSKISMMQISGKSIELGSLPFNLHLRDRNGRMILYGKKGIVITQEMKEMLIRENRSFYISSVDLDNYLDYTINNLEKVVHSRKYKPEKKAEVLRGTGRQLMHNLQAKVVDSTTIEQSKQYVQAMVDFVVSNSRDFYHLLSSPRQDSYYSDHALNSSAFCILLGMEVFSKNDEGNLFILGLGGLLHDIGMAHIDHKILLKEEELSVRETKVIEMHVRLGLHQVESRDLPQEALDMILHHHERADGSGYPDGLKEDAIGIHTQIAAVSDVYDAMTSKRGHRPEKQHIQALETLFSDKHLYFDDVLKALARVVIRNDQLASKLLDRHNLPSVFS